MKETSRIFDAHLHIESGLQDYDLRIDGANIIFNSLESYRRLRKQWTRPMNAMTLLFDFRDGWEFVRTETASGRVQALKIHSRIQGIRAPQYKLIGNKIERLPSNLPIVVDAFYYGADMETQPNLAEIARLARRFTGRPWVMAHAGGHRTLDYFLHLRELPNIYYDLSLSLQYLEDTSALMDLKKLVRFTDKNRILFGSDFPGASPRRQRAILMKILAECEVTPSDAQNIFYNNARRLYCRGARS
ncbi:MAG TPA: amidohydrolase family protein [Elusimicrobiota bacterium]|nr:amidohydrolase family protein [Elusimicrobiota bacterium]